MICAPYLPSELLGGVSTGTSTTRPTGVDLYAGKMFYETDTTRLMIYAGSWKRLGSALRTGRTGGWWERSAPLTVPSSHAVSQFIDVGWDDETEDSDGFLNHGPVTGVTGTIPAGLGMTYSLLVSFAWSTTELGTPVIRVWMAGEVYDMSTPAPGGRQTLPITLPLDAGQTFKVQAWQNSGVPVTMTGRLILVGNGMF